MRFPGIIILLLCIPCVAAIAQFPRFKSERDSILYTRADTAFALSFRNPDSALVLARTVLREAESISAPFALPNSWNALGWILMHKGKLDSSVLCLEKAWQLFSQIGYTNDIIKACINIAEVYTKQDKLSNALSFLLQADSLCVKTDNKIYQTNVFRQLGIVYRESGDFNRATFYLNRAFNGFLSSGDYFRHINTGVSLSILYRRLDLPDSSLYILNRCRVLLEQYPGTAYQVAMVEEHLGETFYVKQQFIPALDYYKRAYRLFKELNNPADIAFETINVGKTLGMLDRHEEAETFLLEALQLADSVNMLNYQLDAASELALLYRKAGNWQRAYHFSNRAGILKDSIDKSEQVRISNELKEKFESEKKEQEILLLKSKNALAEADNRKNRLLQYIFILLFVSALAIGWLLINRMRIKRRLYAQLLRNQIAGDLHDDIGSALSSIDISCQVTLAKAQNDPAIQDRVTRIRQQARQTLDSMSDIVWSVNPSNDSFESLLARLKEFAVDTCEPAGIQLAFFASEETQKIVLNTLARKNIFLIGKEAINNAVKYSACTKLSVSFLLAGKKMLLITILDDGKGFDIAIVRKGNGLKSMQDRAAALEARLRVDSTPGKGTLVELSYQI